MPIITEIKNRLSHLWQDVITGSPLTYAAFGVGLFAAAIYFKIVFGSFQGFRDSLDGLGRWSLWGFLNWETLKFTIWVLISVGSGYAAYCQLPAVFPQWFRRG